MHNGAKDVRLNKILQINTNKSERQRAKNITDYRQNEKTLPTTDSKIINRLLTWTDIIDICFQKEGYFVFFGSIQIKFWLVRWSNGKNFRFVDTRTCISLQLDQYQNHRSHTLKILATTQRWVTSLYSSTPQNEKGIEWVCGAYENFYEDNPPISKPPRILSLRWLDRAFIDFA